MSRADENAMKILRSYMTDLAEADRWEAAAKTKLGTMTVTATNFGAAVDATEDETARAQAAWKSAQYRLSALKEWHASGKDPLEWVLENRQE